MAPLRAPETFATGRNATLDYARLVGAGGIVLFHSGAPGSQFGYAALPFFTMLLVVLAVPAARRRQIGAFAGGRARRLLVPWLIWSLVYGALKLSEAVVTPRTMEQEFLPWMLLTGPVIHLWFLPFAFVLSLAVWLASRLPPLPWPLLLTAGMALTFLATIAGQLPTPIPLEQWLFVLPSAIAGLTFALVGTDRGRLSASLAALLAVCGLARQAGFEAGVFELALAGTALAACLAFPLPVSRLSVLAGESALTVYLAHPMFASLLDRLSPLSPATLAAAGLTFLLSFGLALVLGWPYASRARP